MPSRDVTSGMEAHGAARYLDVAPAEDGRVDVDVDLAYNPYCAYDDAFCRPLPPPDNWLAVPLGAGETAYAP